MRHVKPEADVMFLQEARLVHQAQFEQHCRQSGYTAWCSQPQSRLDTKQRSYAVGGIATVVRATLKSRPIHVIAEDFFQILAVEIGSLITINVYCQWGTP